MEKLEPQIHEVWTFYEDGLTREVFPTARIDVGSVTLLIVGIGSLFLSEFILMEVWNGWAFLTSGPLGLLSPGSPL